MNREHVEILIVGAGFAGAATAAALTSKGATSVALVERESIPGRHASGKNAAMARRVIGDTLLAALASHSVDLIGALSDRSENTILTPSGGLVIGDEPDIEALYAAAGEVGSLRADMTRVAARELTERLPLLSQCLATDGIATSECGIVDIHALLQDYLRTFQSQGGHLHLSHGVTAVETQGGRVSGAIINDTLWTCDLLVNAAGPWAGQLGSMVGAAPMPLSPCRRHLYVSGPMTGLDASWPFVWDITRQVYFRPEGSGLLMCACDVTEMDPSDPSTDPTHKEVLAHRFAETFPTLKPATVAQGWAGLRVLTPDDRFIIGPDPNVDGLYWIAGLGGHGMTCSAGVGEIAAEGILSGTIPGPYREGFSPARFVREHAASSGRAPVSTRV